MTVASNSQAAALCETLRLSAQRRALEAAKVNRSAAERYLLSRPADSEQASSRALVERLAGHFGVGQSSRTTRLVVVNSKVGG